MENKKDHCKFIIQRFDNFINAANVKGNFLLAFNTFLVGIAISNYSGICDLIECKSKLYVVNSALVILIFACLGATFLILKAVYPYLISGNSSPEKYHSHIFFNSVAAFSSGKEYSSSLSKQSENDENEDLAHQAYQLAKGLKSKYTLLKWAIQLIYSELIILGILVMIIIIY